MVYLLEVLWKLLVFNVQNNASSEVMSLITFARRGIKDKGWFKFKKEKEEDK